MNVIASMFKHDINVHYHQINKLKHISFFSTFNMALYQCVARNPNPNPKDLDHMICKLR